MWPPRLIGARMLVLAMITIACAPSWPRERVAKCGGAPQYREGYHRVVHRLAPHPSRGDQRGAIVALMTQANSRQTEMTAVVRLFQGEGRAATDVLRGSRADANGRALFDSLPPGRYYVEGLAIGFSRLGDFVQVRAGFQDTVELQMRTDPLCLFGVGIGAT